MITEVTIAKLVGGFAGAVLALIFIPPKTLAGFFRRSIASLITGPVFAPVTHAQFGWADTWEMWLAASALTSFLSWWLLGVIVGAAKKWITDKTAGETD
jgi:hypothetical protein